MVENTSVSFFVIQIDIIFKHVVHIHQTALSAKAAAGEIIVVDSIKMDNIKTKDFRAFLGAVKAEGKALVVTPVKNENVIKSARNIPGVETTMANLINVYDILKAKNLVLDKEALAVIEEVFA